MRRRTVWAIPVVVALFVLTVAGANDGAPVRFNNHTLFVLKKVWRGATVEERAQLVTQRIEAAAKRSNSATDLHVEEASDVANIFAGEYRLLAVSDEDAAGTGKTRAELASEWAALITVAIENYRDDWSWRVILRGALLTLGATAVLILLLLLLIRGRAKLRRLRHRWRWRDDGSKLQWTVRTLGRSLRSTIAFLETAALWIAVLIIFNLYVPLVLSFFPGTELYAHSLNDWVFEPLMEIWPKIIAFLPNLLIIVVVIAITFYIIRLNGVLFEAVAAGELNFRGFYAEWAEPTAKLLRVLIILLALVVVYPYLPGSGSAAFKGISVFLGVLLSLGSSSAVANAFAGTILVYARAFHLGDRIRVGDSEGDVVERTMFVTRVRTIRNEIITIPNSTILSGAVKNFSADARQHGLILHTAVTIGYDAPWRQVHELLKQAAIRTNGLLAEPAPFVLQTALNDYNVSYELNAHTDHPSDMHITYSELHANIQEEFNKAGVEIMSPGYTALRDGNTVTIPKEYRREGYEAPSFKVTASENGHDAEGEPISTSGSKTGGQTVPS